VVVDSTNNRSRSHLYAAVQGDLWTVLSRDGLVAVRGLARAGGAEKDQGAGTGAEERAEEQAGKGAGGGAAQDAAKGPAGGTSFHPTTTTKGGVTTAAILKRSSKGSMGNLIQRIVVTAGKTMTRTSDTARTTTTTTRTGPSRDAHVTLETRPHLGQGGTLL